LSQPGLTFSCYVKIYTALYFHFMRQVGTGWTGTDSIVGIESVPGHGQASSVGIEPVLGTGTASIVGICQ